MTGEGDGGRKGERCPPAAACCDRVPDRVRPRPAGSCGAGRSGGSGTGWTGSRGVGWHRPARAASRRTVRTWGRLCPPPLARSATGGAACTAESGAPPYLHLNWQAPTRTGRRCLRLRPGPLGLCRYPTRGGAVCMPPGCPPAPLSAMRSRLSGLLVPARRLQPPAAIKMANAPRAAWRIGAAWPSSSREAADHERHGSDQHQASPRHKPA